MIFRLIQSFLRSFFLQTLWNFERMQNMGFAFSVAPLLKSLYSARESYTAALRRHTEFFNTHPYFAPIVLGVVYNREKQHVEAPAPNDDATLRVLKDSMGGAFGAIGDHVLWGTWRPFCVVLALSVGLLVAYPTTAGDGLPPRIFDLGSASVCAKWWIAGFLGMFNAIHLWLRWRGLQKAVSDGPLVVRWVQSLSLQVWASQVRRIALLLLLIMVLFYLSRWTASDMLIWMVAVLLGTMIMKRWALSGTMVFYLVCFTSVVMTKLGIHWP